MLRTSLLLALAALVAAPARADEEAALKLVKKLRGTASRDAKAAGKPVVVVFLDKSKVTDEELKELAALRKLKVLNLYGTKVSDAGLKRVAALKELEGLDLRETKVTGEGLKSLEGLKRLKLLFVPPGAGGAAVKRLQKALPRCKVLVDAGG